MMHASSLRLLGLGCALVLAGACADADDRVSGFSISGVNNITQGTNPTGASASSTGAPTTGEFTSTGEAPATTGDDPDTTGPASGTTTTGVDPSTTTTGVDPSTTTTGVDPSTTTGDDTTGMMTSNTTADETTGEPPPPPPPKDPQPVAGPYEHCLTPNVCDANTDLCLTLNDADDKPTDGFCTLLCDSVADCAPKPVAPAVQECIALDPMTSICALKCAGLKDCPTGMVCANTNLGMYCF